MIRACATGMGTGIVALVMVPLHPITVEPPMTQGPSQGRCPRKTPARGLR